MTQKVKIKDKEFVIYISNDQIAKRIQELAKEIVARFKGKSPVFLAILNGSFIFASDLLKELNIPCEITFVKLASYKGIHSAGKIRNLIGLSDSLKGRDVIILEDIVDTGKTVKELYLLLKKKSVKSITLVTMFFKKEALIENILPDFVGFEVENKFLVGYGLDYEQYGRNLKDIYQLRIEDW
jgi:hypoxanthine phosphoribosyltransferase